MSEPTCEARPAPNAPEGGTSERDAGANASGRRPGYEIRALVLDDDPAICKLLETLLAREGLLTTTLEDPAGLADVLAETSFHLVFLDYMIPNADFEELLKTIHSRCPDACVIVITGYPSVDGAVACIRYRVFDYMIKPFGVEDVRDTVARALRFKGLARLSPHALQAAIGRKIRERRKAKGLTLGQLASRTNLSIGFLSQIELAKNSASVDTLYRIATALGLHPGTFFEELQVEPEAD